MGIEFCIRGTADEEATKTLQSLVELRRYDRQYENAGRQRIRRHRKRASRDPPRPKKSNTPSGPPSPKPAPPPSRSGPPAVRTAWTRWTAWTARISASSSPSRRFTCTLNFGDTPVLNPNRKLLAAELTTRVRERFIPMI